MRFDYNSTTSWNATNGGVLVQTFSLERKTGDPKSRQRIETRIMLRQAGQWSGYSYQWDDSQTDATLIPAKGGETEFAIKDRRAPGGVRKQIWRYPSRAECSACHSRAANFVLGLSDLQMNKVHNYGRVKDNQLRTLQHIGLITNAPYELGGNRRMETHSDPRKKKPSLFTLASTNSPPKKLAELSKLADPYGSNEDLEGRVRAYLHVNCSVCHVGAGGGNSKMQLSV